MDLVWNDYFLMTRFRHDVVSMLLTGLPEFPYSAYILPALLNINCLVTLPFGATAKRTVV